MPINGQQSVLPDPEYIRQLEAELAWLHSQMERLKMDFATINRGR